MMRPIIVLGGGGHAKVVIEALLRSGAQLLGVTDADPARHGSTLLGVPVLGDDAVVLTQRPEAVLLANGLGSTGLPQRRREIFERFSALGYVFISVVHPSAVVSSEVTLGEGAQIMAGAVLQPGCRIGANSIVNTRAAVDHDCLIGAHVHLAPGVTLSGSVTVGELTHIGTGATVIQGIAIGPRAVVAAGAVVVANIAPATTVRGVPARVVT